ncbi:MAG: hypothetical protein JNK48_01360 [Bryobacterales bacterium]|nr:hypothetical protein [Bryobacterales bacterium]
MKHIPRVRLTPHPVLVFRARLRARMKALEEAAIRVLEQAVSDPRLPPRMRLRASLALLEAARRRG